MSIHQSYEDWTFIRKPERSIGPVEAVVEHYGVIIVGGGPAGSSVAHNLVLGAGTGSALLIEKFDRPGFSKYHAMCGEGISRRGLAEAGIECPGLEKNRLFKAVERWPGEISITNEVHGSIIDRTLMITKMRESFVSEGGEVRRDKVSRVRRRGDHFVLECEEDAFSCDYLVGADGARSVVRRDIFETDPPALMKVVQYVVDRPHGNALQFIFDERYHGKYRWEFPSGDHTKIGFPEGTDDPPENVLEVHRREIPVGPLDRIVEGRACLVGDAASQVNPVTFSGIRNALTAGKMAAMAISRGDLESYQVKWESSPLADRSFYGSFTRLREMSNDGLRTLAEPFRYGPNLAAIMRELMNSEGFRAFYRSHVRKMENGW